MTMLFSIDDTINALIDIARARGGAMCGVYPITMELTIVKGLPVDRRDARRATEEEVRTAWAKARAARAVPAYERRERAAS